MKYRFVQKLIISFSLTYLLMLFISPQTANFILALMLVLSVPVLILRYIFRDILYKYSIKMVSRQFVKGNNTLGNEHCTVRYTPDKKIVVIDNFATKNYGRRMFTLKKGEVKINRCWNRVCRVYDSFITLDTLAQFFSYDTKVDIITIESKTNKEEKSKNININTSNSGPKFVEFTAIQPDLYSKGTEKPRDVDEKFVNISNLKEQKPYEKSEGQAPDFVELQDVLSAGSNKIDINRASASEIAILPGINIAKAKKVVEYREKNGLFKDIDEFIKAAEVKEHFIDKIKQMSAVRQPIESNDNNNNNDDDYSEGRIVDF